MTIVSNCAPARAAEKRMKRNNEERTTGPSDPGWILIGHLRRTEFGGRRCGRPTKILDLAGVRRKDISQPPHIRPSSPGDESRRTKVFLRRRLSSDQNCVAPFR